MFLLCLALPAVVYGSRAWDLELSFWKNIILSPAGQVLYMQRLHVGTNQSLDTVMLRYLSYDGAFHGRYASVPHLRFGRDQVLMLANVARAAILLVTVGSVSIWRHRRKIAAPHDILTMMALWSSALYLMLPETRSRYAVYTCLAFIPLLELAGLGTSRRAKVARAAGIAACVILILGLVPASLRVYGVGFIGSLLLWLSNVGLVAWGHSAATAPDEHFRTMRREVHGFG
jgi:hypothetical protein